jgi:N-hydroxyarylamine O-acetyltransferase
VQARVFDGEVPGHPFDHLALRVTVDGRPWLVDVGFGRFSHLPLRLDDRDEQRDPGGIFRMSVSPTGLGELDITRDGTPEYRVDAIKPYALADFVPTAWWQQTSPDSHFTQSLTCSILTESGRTTLSGDRLITTSTGNERVERVLHGDAEILAAYRAHFGITLDRVPTVRRPGP